MYNRYVPQDIPYQWVGETEKSEKGNPLSDLFQKGSQNKTLGALLEKLHLDRLDSGDLFLLLIAGLLFVEKEDVDLAIALVLVVLFDFGGE